MNLELFEKVGGGVPYYRKLGVLDALEPTRKRKRAVPFVFRLAYLLGWSEARNLLRKAVS